MTPQEPPAPADGAATDDLQDLQGKGRALRPNCWCEYCDVNRPIDSEPSRSRRCPSCQDYRCARSAHHDLPCSKLPEAGQPG